MRAAAIDPARLNNPHELPQFVEWMTRVEWEAKFPDEFVAVVDPDYDETKDADITGGFVVHHGSSRDGAYDELIRLKPKCSAVRYAGREDDSVVYML